MSVLLVGTAAAQDPYGGTSTTVDDGPTVGVTCELSLTSAAAGGAITATVRSSPGGTVRILFGGTEVGHAASPAGERSTMQIPFVVPSVDPGAYLVTAVGVDFTAVCGTVTGGLVEVLPGVITRDGGSGGGGPLPRTGIYVLLLLAVAAVLLLLGRALVEESRRRRREEEWELRAAAARATSEAK